MKHVLTFTGSCWAVVLVGVMGLSSYGCSDSVSVSEDVEVPLSSLTITPGSLRPGFSSNTTNYTVNAPTSSSSVTVKAVPKDSTTTMTINGDITTAGQGRSIQLGNPGTTTTITVVLESHNGTGTTYTITVTRLLSGDNNLSALDVTPGNLDPSFDQDTLNYMANAGVFDDTVDVTATLQDTSASMTINGQGTGSGQARPISLGPAGSSTVVEIIVKAPNGSTKVYRITVKRLSGDNNLSDLSVTPGSLVFDRNTVNYRVDVQTNVKEVTVRATKSDLNAAMTGNVIAGPGIPTGTAPIALGGAGSETNVVITVAATDPNVPPKTYTIIVKRTAPSSDKNLSALSLTAGSLPLNLTPTFDPNHLNYTVEVPVGVLSVNVTATKSDPNAVLSGSIPDPGTGVATGQAIIVFILLPPPQVSITVTAPNGSSQTYTVTVNQVLSP